MSSAFGRGDAAPVIGLKAAMDVISREAARQPERTDLQLAKTEISKALAAARIRDRPQTIARMAHLAGCSDETMRRRLMKLFPTAKRGGRYRIHPEMVDALLSET